MQKIIFAFISFFIAAVICKNSGVAKQPKVHKAVIANAVCRTIITKDTKQKAYLFFINVEFVIGGSIRHYFEGTGTTKISTFGGSLVSYNFKSKKLAIIGKREVGIKKIPKLKKIVYNINYQNGKLVPKASVSRSTIVLFSTANISVFKLESGKNKIHVKIACSDK